MNIVNGTQQIPGSSVGRTVLPIFSGTIEVYVGGQQPNQKKIVGSNVLHTSFQITGELVLGKY